MKTTFLTVLLSLTVLGIANANCTLTTDCGTRNYQENSISASTDGQLIIVRNGQGSIIDSFECSGSSISTSCSSGGDGGGGDINICDHLPDFLKPIFGC
ncbi:hypothetical protein [Aquimarina aquimarini]|uniref:hypothetical protein n=1 Tax=Aquimarina aquimarini TaxID=1191734 RepID=UPI001F314E8C|nr:hypothetical protein [Aquimarina aquimarini]